MDKVIELLKNWEKYDSGTDNASIDGFGKWLTSKSLARQNVYENAYSEKVNRDFGSNLGMVISYAEAWERLTFRNFPIRGFNDFAILQHVKYRKSPTKNEIAISNPDENTTVFEVIKRLIRKGFLEERLDEMDKRVRRVMLTKEGLELIEQVDQSVDRMSNLIVGDLKENEIKQMTVWLKRLADFHKRLYNDFDKEEVAERFKL